MGENFSQFENQNGSAILIAVVVLLMLTVLGLSAIRNTGVELQIAANNKHYQRNLYAAEGSGYEASRRIETASADDLDSLNFTWLNDQNTDLTDPSTWDDTNSQAAELDPGTGVIRHAVIDNGIAPGASLDVNDVSGLHAYSVYGVSRRNNGETMVEFGYRKRF